MKLCIAAVTVGLLIVVPLSAQNDGYWGTVYKGEGTGTPSGRAWVKATGIPVTDSTQCNSSGGYGLQGLTPYYYYELYAWNYHDGEKWTDWAWKYLTPGYHRHDFHLQRGEPEKK